MPIETNKSYASSISGEENNRQLTTGFNKDVSPSAENSKFKIEVPKIELPKGGGAIKGIEEKFQVNAITGTSSFSIPIPLSPSRHSFIPAIGLNYNSGNGNSPFGLGWQLDIPSISRKTEKELPQYKDEEESDTFILSGADDLVPLLQKQENEWQRFSQQRTENGVTFTVKRYRPALKVCLPLLKNGKTMIAAKPTGGR